MQIKEIKASTLNTRDFIRRKTQEIKQAVGAGYAINALSGGVDSSAVTMIGHKALGEGLKTIFVENGLMREGEPQRIVALFRDLGVHVQLVDARKEFLDAEVGDHDPAVLHG